MKKSVFITGATNGTGYAIAKRFAKEGYDVFIGSRNGENSVKAAAEIAAEYGVFAKGYETIIFDENNGQLIQIKTKQEPNFWRNEKGYKRKYQFRERRNYQVCEICNVKKELALKALQMYHTVERAMNEILENRDKIEIELTKEMSQLSQTFSKQNTNS